LKSSHPHDGLESTIDDLRAFCRKAPEVERLILAEMEPGQTLSEAGAKGGRGHKASDNVTGFRGNSSSAIGQTCSSGCLRRAERQRGGDRGIIRAMAETVC
jgi:hypothetical protein